jgi:hypothetical protein
MGGPSKFIQGLEVIDHKPREERTMKIKLMADWTGCLDGIHLSAHAAGLVHEFPVHIATVLLGDGRAVLPESEAKAIAGAPENKMEPGPGSNKVKRSRKRSA